MLAELRIADLGVIDEATIEPGPGFTAVTGETGAGKTMIVTGLALLVGAKADPKLVRHGASRALVEGRWRVAADTAAAAGGARRGDRGRRGAGRAGRSAPSRSRMTVGGAQVPLGTGCRRGRRVGHHPRPVRAAAARLAGAPARGARPLRRPGAGSRARRLPRRATPSGRPRPRSWPSSTTQSQARARELDLLRFGLDEIAKVDPQPGEDVALAAETVRLQAVDDLRLAAHAALAALAGDEDDYETPDALGLVGAARKALGAGRREGPDARAAGRAARRCGCRAGRRRRPASPPTPPGWTPTRCGWSGSPAAGPSWRHLTRKYGDTVDEVLAWARRPSRGSWSWTPATTGSRSCGPRSPRSTCGSTAAAGRITALRAAAATELAGLVAGRTRRAGDAALRLVFELTPAAELGPHGADQVNLLFSANPGSTPGAAGQGGLRRRAVARPAGARGGARHGAPAARPSSSTRWTPASAARSRSRSDGGWPGSPSGAR